MILKNSGFKSSSIVLFFWSKSYNIKAFCFIELSNWSKAPAKSIEVHGRSQHGENNSKIIHGPDYFPLLRLYHQQKSCISVLIQQKSYCDVSISFLNPSYLVHRIDYIYYKSDQLGNTQGKMEVKAIEEEKEKVKQHEYPVLRKLKNIPAALLQENSKKLAGYKDVEIQENINMSVEHAQSVKS